MSPDFEREQSAMLAPPLPEHPLNGAVDDDAMDDAAQALRAAEVAATLPDLHLLNESQLERMSIDELRAVAGALNVPHRAQITEQDELVEAIRRCL
jgi:hypothetical protein